MIFFTFLAYIISVNSYNVFFSHIVCIYLIYHILLVFCLPVNKNKIMSELEVQSSIAINSYIYISKPFFIYKLADMSNFLRPQQMCPGWHSSMIICHWDGCGFKSPAWGNFCVEFACSSRVSKTCMWDELITLSCSLGCAWLWMAVCLCVFHWGPVMKWSTSLEGHLPFSLAGRRPSRPTGSWVQ